MSALTESGATRPEGDALAEILSALGPIEGRAVLDVGCGRGRLAAALVGRGARVTAVDPEDDICGAARRAAPQARVLRAGGEALPFDDGVFDGVVMLNSLHHVPDPARALAEVARVAKPDAPIVVVEPLAEGSFFDAMLPLEDETEIRAAAQAAIAAACRGDGPLRMAATCEFYRVERFPDADAFIERLVAVDPARREKAAAARPEIERRFGRLAAGDAEATLRQPLRMHLMLKRAG